MNNCRGVYVSGGTGLLPSTSHLTSSWIYSCTATLGNVFLRISSFLPWIQSKICHFKVPVNHQSWGVQSVFWVENEDCKVTILRKASWGYEFRKIMTPILPLRSLLGGGFNALKKYHTLKPLQVPKPPPPPPPTALGRESWITPFWVSRLVTLAILRKLPWNSSRRHVIPAASRTSPKKKEQEH